MTTKSTTRAQRTDDLHVGSGPAEEQCAQVGSEGYHWRAWHECRALIGQLRRAFGPEPPACRLSIKQNPHDSGAYLSVNCAFPAGDERGAAYASRCERELPKRWDAEARDELGLGTAPDAPRIATAKAEPKARGKGRRGRKGGSP